MKNSLVVFIVLVFLAFSVRALAHGYGSQPQPAESDAASEFEKALLEKAAGIQSISCRFLQTRTMSVLVQSVSETGTFIYMRPGNILLAFPDGDFIKMTENHFAMRNEGETSQVKISSNPMLKELKKILTACMTADIKAMSSGFRMAVEKVSGGYAVQLTPIRGRGQARFREINMNFEAEDMSLTMLEIVEASGDGLKYEFYEKVFNTDVSSAF